LITRARKAGHRAIIAAIDADQPASIALHSKFDFKKCRSFQTSRLQVRPLAGRRLHGTTSRSLIVPTIERKAFCSERSCAKSTQSPPYCIHERLSPNSTLVRCFAQFLDGFSRPGLQSPRFLQNRRISSRFDHQRLGHDSATWLFERFCCGHYRRRHCLTYTNLSKYAAVVWLSTTGDVLDNNQQAEFQQYIHNSGGYVGIHSARTLNTPGHGMANSSALTSPITPQSSTATIKIADAAHPSTAGLPRRWTRTDECTIFNPIRAVPSTSSPPSTRPLTRPALAHGIRPPDFLVPQL